METKPLSSSDINIKGTNNFRDTKDSDVIVITAGAQRKAGMSREDLTDINKKIVGDIIKNAIKYSKNAKIIVVTNPLDAMVHLAKKLSRFPKERVMGMAGILDSSRFKTFISMELDVSVEDISALVLGGHGDSMIPLPNHASVNGIPLKELLSKKRIDSIVKRTRNAGAEIIKLEKDSSAFFSPGASVTEMVESIIKDKKRILPCAAYLNWEYGIKGIYMGVPVKLGARGIEKIIELRLSKEEKRNFVKSANAVKKAVVRL